MAYLELRNHIWHAVLTVPQDARDKLGKLRFKLSLETSNEKEAQLLAAPHVAKWKAEIRQARGTAGAVSNEALRWRAALAQIDDPDTRETLELLLSDAAESVEKEQGTKKAQDFYDVGTGAKTPTNSHYEAWKAQLALAPKTMDQMVKDVDLFIAKFPLLESITPESVFEWASGRIERKECTESSMGPEGAPAVFRQISKGNNQE